MEGNWVTNTFINTKKRIYLYILNLKRSKDLVILSYFKLADETYKHIRWRFQHCYYYPNLHLERLIRLFYEYCLPIDQEAYVLQFL